MNLLRRIFTRRVVLQDARAERDDVIHYLARKRNNALRVAANSSPSAETRAEARVAARQFDLLMQDIRTGLHEGEREVVND